MQWGEEKWDEEKETKGKTSLFKSTDTLLPQILSSSSKALSFTRP
jgi:hypothetical protein